MLTHIPGNSRSRPIMRLTHSAMTGCSRAACHTRETCPFWSEAQLVSSLCCLDVSCGCFEFGPGLTERDACRRCHNGNLHRHGIHRAHLPGHVPGTGTHPARGRSISPSPFANSAVSAGEADSFIYAPALLAMTALKAQCTIHVWLGKLLAGTSGRY